MAKKADVKPGDLVKVYTKIKEGDKERVTQFQGVVMRTRGAHAGKTFTVRKISAGVGIERIFPLQSPLITKIEIKKRGKVRRAKLTYLKKRTGKRMKIRESSQKTDEFEETIIEEQPAEATVTPEPPAETEKPKAGKKSPGAKKKDDAPAPPEKEKPEAKKGESAPGQKSVEKS
ncbi:hypothetical protein AMJ87_09245 [candidate division WOR_3 bacterium SM23_60]|uniref:50S ribosomal protein L19 n=1 Tax=candidate division WOR_3 bacterium SM23_60 TaxID=1703780 RepID=A0A0S8GB40_UNCW3|nr:MAG: hypothetical protein AMJ87_09245 [candidate division WOR_3 bacterium SM23_60]